MARARLNHEAAQRELERQRWLIQRAADRIGVSRSHLSNILRGDRAGGVEIALKLGALLEVSPFSLLGPDDPEAARRQIADALDADPTLGELPAAVAS